MTALALLLGAAAASVTCGGDGSSVAPSPVAWPQSERVQALRHQLHIEGSGAQARDMFPDLVLTYVDDGRGLPYPARILPFEYYWSPSAQVSVAICAVGKTVLVCPYYLRNPLAPAEFGSCDVAGIYKDAFPAPPVGR